MDLEVQVKEAQSKGSFFIENEGKVLAEMTFSKAGAERIIIDHTEVDESLRGKGAGLKLLESAVNYVRKRNIKLLPLCPFAKATLQKHPEWKDVW